MRKYHSIFDSFQFTYELDICFDLEKVIDLFDYIHLQHMTVLPLRLSLSLTFREKLFAHLFDKTADDYVISHVTSYLSKYVEHPPPSRPLVVDQLTCFYTKNAFFYLL